MSVLHFLMGIPGSGKTTRAKELEAIGYVRINKDSLREMLFGDTWKQKKEKEVINARDALVSLYLSQGRNVVVDDTNFNMRHRERLKQLAKEHGASFKVELIDTPLEVCLERNAQRTGKARVPDHVIRNMWIENVRGPVGYDSLLPRAVIVDIDGTLAMNVSGRSPYAWERVGEDQVNEQVKTVVNLLADEHKIIIVLSGRDEVCRPETEAWLKENRVMYDRLYMRPIGNKVKDSIIKEALFRQYIEDAYYPWLVIDDRDSVINLWRTKLGLTTWQVNYGEF